MLPLSAGFPRRGAHRRAIFPSMSGAPSCLVQISLDEVRTVLLSADFPRCSALYRFPSMRGAPSCLVQISLDVALSADFPRCRALYRFPSMRGAPWRLVLISVDVAVSADFPR